MSHSSSQPSMAAITLTALGVVYGDIGTSPLYTLKACFNPGNGLEPTPANILGVLSLIFWALILVVSGKYLSLVLNASDRGEGGILTLMALARRQVPGRLVWAVLIMGLMGGGFFYGEVIITPAMSVLSAMEGLEVLTPELAPYVIPLALLVLTALFFLQQHGTAKVGQLFGPIMAIWFTVLALLGIIGISHNPMVLNALNPLYAIDFICSSPWLGFLSLGAVVLAITGTEALYADMGHFGVRPIRRAWFSFVLPALLLNYFGQGALLLAHPETAASPFFHLAPSWALLPLVILSTLATVIASQAVISGVFSLTRQAMQLGYIPHLSIVHTSEREIGQIFIPWVNRVLFIAVVAVMLAFGSSSNLAAAYGMAVTGTMVITGTLLSIVAYRKWHWPLWLVIPLQIAMLAIDLPFFAANVMKIPHGGWLPLAIGLIMFTLMTTWRRGNELMFKRLHEDSIPLPAFAEHLEADMPTRISGTAVFLAKSTKGVPRALLHNLKHNKVLHERVIVMTIVANDIPYVSDHERVSLQPISASFCRVIAHYGFKETADLQDILRHCANKGLEVNLMDASFFLSRETLIISDYPGLSRWRKVLFVWLNRNALRATDFFRIPINRIVELGAQMKL